MALQSLGGSGWPLIPLVGGWPQMSYTNVANTLDAVGESVAMIGRVFLDTGPGTSKVLSTGKIYFLATSVTFVNAGTTIRVGIQDVTMTTGIEDGTYDVFDDLVGATDDIVSGNFEAVTMSSGTKTITHGDTIAVVIEITARGGADTIRVNTAGATGSSQFPYCTLDTGSGPAKVTQPPLCMIEFDDGTIGHFGEGTLVYELADISYKSDTAGVDEYALIITPPFTCVGRHLLMVGGEVDSGEDGELILYSDPLGTPVAERTATPDPDLYGSAGSSVQIGIYNMATDFTFTAGVTYAIAYRPTTTGARTLRRVTLPTANARKATTLGTNWRQGTRLNNTGVFTESAIILPVLGVLITQLDDGAGGGGGPVARSTIVQGIGTY